MQDEIRAVEGDRYRVPWVEVGWRAYTACGRRISGISLHSVFFIPATLW